MRIESAHAYEGGPARRMSQRGVTAAQERELGFTQRQRRIAFWHKGAMETHEEAAADCVVEVPQAGHDVGNACRQKRPAKAKRAFDTRDRSSGRAAGGEDDDTRAREARAPQVLKV